MLAVILKEGVVQVEQVEKPKPKKNEELVRIDYCGICGTDYQKYLNFSNAHDLGHEVLGTLLDKKGNELHRVIVRTSFPCGKCNMCIEQQHTKCLTWKRAEINGLSEYISIDRKCIIPIYSKENELEYALIEPLYVAINLVKKICSNKEDIVAIIGNGTIGLLAAFYLWLNGYKHINIYARINQGAKPQFATSLGIKTYNFNQDIKTQLPTANKIINTAPYETMVDVIKHAAPHTDITFNGISKNTFVTLDMITWHFKNLTISPSFPHPQTDFSEAVEIVRMHGKTLRPLITHIFPLEEAPKVFDLMKHKKIDYIKVLIKI